MGRQDGLNPIKGSVGTYSYYKKGNEYFVRKKGGIDAKRIKTDPAYERTRQHGAEFGRAGKASKLLRDSLRVLLITAADSRVTSRLTRKMLRVIKSDPVNKRGERTAAKGDLTELKNFEFNALASLKANFPVQYVINADRANGLIQVQFEAFITNAHVIAPIGVSHFKITIAAVELDFDEEAYTVKMSSTEPIDRQTGKLTLAPLEVNVTPNSNKPIVVVAGIEFGDYFQGEYAPFQDKSKNALKIVMVDAPV